MFNEIGKKIKILAMVQCWVGIIVSAVIAIVLIYNDIDESAIGNLVIIFGSLLSWATSFIIYGFGELIEKTCDIERNMRKGGKGALKPSIEYNVKRCETCGEKIFRGANFCAKCGEKIENGNFKDINSDEEYVDLSGETGDFTMDKEENTLPMNWYSFLVHFALIAGAVVNSGTGLICITRGIYELPRRPYYGYLNVLYALALFGCAALQIVTRKKLIAYRQSGPKFLYMLYAISLVVGLAYDFAYNFTWIRYNVMDVAVAIGSAVTNMAFLIVNIRYFSRRAHLFKN